MRDWYHGRPTDLGLRAVGVMLCGGAWLAIRALLQMHVPGRLVTPGWAEYALAAVGFVCASVGTALVVFGHHIFDEIDIGERSRRRLIVGDTTDQASGVASAPRRRA